MMKKLQHIWKHKREFQINIFMVIGIDKFQFIGLNDENILHKRARNMA